MDGNEYIDVAMGMGVHFFGHKPRFVVEALRRQMDEGAELGTQCDLTGEVASLIRELTGVERVTFCNTGSEAVMVAIRLARAATRRPKLVLFRNSYHGIFDGVLAAEEDGRIVPVGPGTPPGMVQDVMVWYGQPPRLEAIAANASSLAAVLVEPVQSRNQLATQGLKKRAPRTRCGAHLRRNDQRLPHPEGPGLALKRHPYGKIVGGGPHRSRRRQAFLNFIDGGWQYGDNSGRRR